MVRLLPASGFAAAFAAAWVLAGGPARAGDTTAEKPSDLAVTVYRSPNAHPGSIDLDELAGFALISETRTVHLPAGVGRLRFEGVADGIEPVSAIVTGLPNGVLEKNREGQLLSPSALLAAAADKPVTLLRTDEKTGKLSRMAGRIRSDAGNGVVFETAQGIEALRCSGLAESVSFTGVADLAATPTLSVLVRSPEAVTETVTLSYLARGFDWAADYAATVSADGKTLDLGAWVTLANGNGVGFPAAHTQVVAGRVNRESGEVEPLDVGGPILAECWPRGSTSDSPPQYLQSAVAASRGGMEMDRVFKISLAAPAALLAKDAVSARPVEQEQLGDLKLYRVPDRTTVAGRQSKQVRLLDRSGIPVTRIFGADLAADETATPAPAHVVLRTVNDTAHHLGLPLPSGRVAVSAVRSGAQLLLDESGLRDIAVNEEVEFDLGDSPDVQVTTVTEKVTIDAMSTRALPLLPGVVLRPTKLNAVSRVEISNARAAAVQFELRLRLPQGGGVVRADHPLTAKNGRPMFRLTIPAGETVIVRYQTQATTG